MSTHAIKNTANDANEWSTALAALVFQALGMGLIAVYGFYITPVSEQFDVSVATMNLGLAMLLLLSGVMSPWLGRFIDGAALKPVILSGAGIAALGLTAAAFVSTFSLLIAAFLLFSIGVVLYGPVVCNLLLVRAYQTNRARALAIAAMGVSFASILLPLLVASMLNTIHWQMSLLVLAGIVVIGVGGGVLFLVREPDRKELATSSEQELEELPVSGFTGDINFWAMGVITVSVMSIMSLFAIILVPHFLNVGLDNSQAALIMASSGFAGLCGKTSLAYLSDRIRPYLKTFAVFLCAELLVAWLLLLNFESLNVMMLATIMLGFGHGAFIPLLPYMNSVFFEEQTLGRITGLHMAMMMPPALVGPWLAGRYYDQNDSYIGVFLVLSVAMLITLISVTALKMQRSPPVDAAYG
ncbi:MAG: MFS transporter [Pseudomonadales bacterium]